MGNQVALYECKNGLICEMILADLREAGYKAVIRGESNSIYLDMEARTIYLLDGDVLNNPAAKAEIEEIINRSRPVEAYDPIAAGDLIDPSVGRQGGCFRQVSCALVASLLLERLIVLTRL